MKTGATIVAILGICIMAWAITDVMEVNKEIGAFEDDYQHIVPRLNYSLPPTEFIQQIGDGCEVSDDVDECVKTIYADTKQANDFAQNVDGDYNPYIITDTDLQDREDDVKNGKIGIWMFTILVSCVWLMAIALANMEAW